MLDWCQRSCKDFGREARTNIDTAVLPETSYLTLIATVCMTACVMIALTHLAMWFRSNREPAHLFATVMAIAAAFVTITDLQQIFALDKDTYVQISRFQHVALFVLLISMVTFVRSYLGTGPRWLIGLIAALWVITVIQAMVLPNGVIHAEIIEMAYRETSWGEPFYVPRGPVNPGKYFADVSVLLILAFLVIASLDAARQGQRKRAGLVGGSTLFFVVCAGTLAMSQDAGLLSMPLVLPLPFLAVIGGLTYQLVDEAFQARDNALEVEQLRRVLTLGEMVGGLTHEINQPLTAILSNAQAARRFLARGSADTGEIREIREIIEDIITEDKRASGIVQGFRNMLQRQEKKDGIANVRETVLASAALVKGEFHAHDVSLQVDLQPKHARVQTDPIELEQVLVNLLINAARAVAENDGADRHVTLRCTEREGSANFSVEDSGPGIGSEMHDRLFQPFVSTSKAGLGLGLAICKRIVERSGGKIWAEQRPGGGAVFRFTLPLEQVAAAQ